jgi:hypothetical protein
MLHVTRCSLVVHFVPAVTMRTASVEVFTQAKISVGTVAASAAAAARAAIPARIRVVLRATIPLGEDIDNLLEF